MMLKAFRNHDEYRLEQRRHQDFPNHRAPRRTHDSTGPRLGNRIAPVPGGYHARRTLQQQILDRRSIFVDSPNMIATVASVFSAFSQFGQIVEVKIFQKHVRFGMLHSSHVLSLLTSPS